MIIIQIHLNTLLCLVLNDGKIELTLGAHMVLQCTALCCCMNCKQIHHTLVPRQTFVLTQDYEWESRALNLTVPKTPSVADTGMWPLPLLSFSRHPQALHNCLSASDESREQLGKIDKPHALSAWLRAHELTFIVWKWDSFNLAKQ